MITLRGTSHIASDDLAEIRTLVEETEPDVVALELDEKRLKALLSEEEQPRSRNPFLLLLKTIQDILGKQTGAVPGSDMLEAFSTAAENGIDVALIDQDITVTLRKLKDVPLLEKFKFAGFLGVGSLLYFIPGVGMGPQVDLQQVPEEGLIERLLLQFNVSFPSMYDVLVTERNDIMAAKLEALDERYDNVLAFVGAGHVQGIQEQVEVKIP